MQWHDDTKADYESYQQLEVQFLKSRMMVVGCYFKNMKTVVSVQQFQSMQLNLARWHIGQLWTPSAVESSKFLKIQDGGQTWFCKWIKLNIWAMISRYMHQICQRHAKLHFKQSYVCKLLRAKSNIPDVCYIECLQTSKLSQTNFAQY